MSKIHRRCFAIALLLLAFVVGQSDGEDTVGYYLPGDLSYNAEVPTPEAFFGFEVGEWHLRHDQIVAYVKALAEASDRVAVEEFARTYEQRPLLLLTITSPENHRRIAAIREAHAALSDPARSDSLLIAEMPAVVWMGYSIHGNEASGSNAAPVVAYYLAAAQGEAVERMLERMVILIDPSLNPDGLSRFAHWANMHRGKRVNPDPNHREHLEAWPAGRTNHYWFDLNRDWMPAQHPESRGRLKVFHAWKPNVLTDHHEMGTDRTYFFQPGVPSRNNPLTPERVYELTRAMANFHARALDEIGSLYYTKEGFDDFYVGKGSSYPDLNGCIGILFEQASARGHAQESENGLLRFPFAIRNQVATSLSTLRAVQELRVQLLAHQREFFKSALVEAERSPVRAYLFGSEADPVRNYHFLDLLHRHGIKVYEVGRPVRIEDREFRPGSGYIVPVHQPQYRMLTALFERRTTFEDSLFYDVSAWTLPLAFNLPHAAFRSRALPAELLGRRVDRPAFPQGERVGEKGPYAYVFEWNGYYAPRALYRLLEAGVRAKVATRPFEAATAAGGRRFDYGTVLVPVGSQEGAVKRIEALVETIAREDGIRVYAMQTGLSANGIDLGSPSFAALKKPEVMLAVGQGVTAYDAGEVWHLLDRRFDMDVSLVEVEQLGSVDLSRYTTVVMPDGSYAGVDSSRLARLRGWVQSGGTLIAMGRAAKWAVDRQLASVRLKRPDVEDEFVRRPYAEAPMDRGAQVIGGAIFEAILDRTHPIGYGYDEDRVSIFRKGTVFLNPSRSAYATPLFYPEFPLLSGYISEENAGLLKESASIVVSGLEGGRVILFADNPNFRAFWYGTNKLFLNAIFFGPTIDLRTVQGEEGDL